MFGYIRICKPPMTCGDYDLYRGVYCSLCKALGRRYGPFARLTLNYDMTFYALLALREAEETEFTPSRCSFNPLKKCLRCKCAALDAAADVSMLLVYYKWLDNLQDSAWYAKIFWALPGIFFLPAGRKAKRRAPEAGRLIRVAVSASRLQENTSRRCAPPPSNEGGCIDTLAHPSAHALGALCALLNPALYRLGYLLGRWVYLMDAADDYEGDVKRGRFNPFAVCEYEPKELVRATSSELARSWEEVATPACGSLSTVVSPAANPSTEGNEFHPILSNILTLGLADMEQRLFEEGEANEKSL